MGLKEVHKLFGWFGNKIIVLVEDLIGLEVGSELRRENRRERCVEESSLLRRGGLRILLREGVVLLFQLVDTYNNCGFFGIEFGF